MKETLTVKLNALVSAIGEIKNVMEEYKDEVKQLERQRDTTLQKIESANSDYSKAISRLSAEKSELEKYLEEGAESLKEVKQEASRLTNESKKLFSEAQSKAAEANKLFERAENDFVKANSLKNLYQEKIDSFNKVAQAIK